MEELDEFGIPIKKQTSKVTLDEFGIPIKKKDALQPTSTPQKSVSGTSTGSSGGVNPAFKNTIPSPIPDFNSMKSVKSVAENNELVKSKRIKELETSFYASTKDNTDDAVAEQRLQDRKANKGFWNTAEDLTKSAYNTVVDAVSASNPLFTGLQGAKISEDPLEDEKKQALLEAKKNKVTLSEDQKNARAEEIFKQKEKDNLFIDRANSYLDNLDVKDKDILEQNRLDKYTHLQEENQKKFKVVSAMETVGNEKIKEYQAVEKQLLDLKKNGQEFPKELYDKYSNLGVEINQISGNIQKYSDQIQKNKSDLGTIEQEYDLFKRGYGDMDNFMGNAIATSGELANGIFGAVNYFASLSPDPITRLNSMRGQEIANKISGKLEEYRGALRKPVESVESAEGFVNYASDLVANQLPVLAVTSTGAGGLAALGASTTGQTFTKINQENLTGKANYTPLQMAAIPLLQGGFEVISEIPTLSILKKGSRVISAAANGEIDLIKKSGREIFKGYAKDFGKEFGGEHITNLGQNFNARYVQGKEEVGLLDNTGRVSKDTAFLTTLLQGSPHVFGAVAKVFQSNQDFGTLDENSRKIIEFSKQLNTEGLTDTEKTVIQKQIDKVTAESSKIVANTIGKIGDMPNVSYDEIVSLNSQAGKLKSQAKEIKDGKLPNKEALLTSLWQDYKELQTKRNGLIDGSITPFDLLSGNEQAKRLTQASREITKRDNPDGTKEKFEVKPEDAKELASENYLKEIKEKENEQTPTTTEAKPLAEVPQQAEAEKVATPPVEDVVATSVEKPSDEQQLEDVKNGDIVSFTYGDKSEIPEIFKDKISSEGEINGKKEIKVTIAKSLAEYHLQNEATPQTNTPTDGNVRPTASNVGESGNTKQESPVQESVSSSVDGGEVKGDVEVGKTIEPHSEVNTDVETVKKELNLNEVDNLLYDELKDTPTDKVFDKIDKIKDDKLGEIETIEKKMDDVDLKMEDNGDAIDKIDEDETLSAAKKKKAIAVLEKEFKDLQKQRENLESQKEGVEKLITDIDDALFHPTEDYNADKVSELIDKVNTRLETRKSIKEGTNLFPEDANIPEFVAVKKELIKLTDEKTIADFNSRTAEQVKESEPIIADIKSKAKNAERISKEELEKGIADAEKLLKPPKTKERIAERIKLSDAKVDNIKDAINGIDSIFGIKIKVDDIEGLNKNGIDIVEVIANIAKQAIAAGIHIDEAINKTIEHLKKTIDFDVNIDEIKEKINTKVEEEKDFKREKGKSSVLKRIREGGNSTEINKIIDKIGLNYEGRKQEQVYADGVNFVKEVGIAEAYNAIKNGELKDSDTINVVYATILQGFSNMAENEISKVYDPQELSDLVKELDDLHEKIYTEFKAKTIDAGRGSAILNFIYNQDLKIRYSLSQQIENFKKVNNGVVPSETLAKMKELDKQYQEANKRIEELEGLLKEAQEQRDFENIVEEEKRQPKLSKTKREKAEKIIKALDDFEKSMLQNSYSDATMITPILIQGIRATKLAIKQGVNIAEAIEKGINGIKKELEKLGKTFDNEERFRNDLNKYLDGIDVELQQPKVTVDKNGKVRIPTEMIKDYISKGGTDLSEFAIQVQESIKDEFPDVSVREIRESVSNYGKKVNKSRLQIVEDIQKLKSEERLRLEYEDLQNRISKEKNETKKRTLSQTAKRLKEQIKQLQDDLGITETERTNRSVNYTKKRIEILREKIKNNDFAKKEIKPIVESQELKEAKIEKNRVQEEFDYLSYQQELENRTFFDKANEFAKDIYDSQRVTLATGEMSFVGAQGGLYMVDSTFSRQTLKNLIENFKGTTAKEWKANPVGTVLKMVKSAHSAESLIKMFNSMGTANNYLDFQRMLKEDINYDVYLKSGLRLLGEDVKTQVKDDNFIGNNILTLLKIPIHLIDRIEKKELKNLKLSLAETEKKRTTLQGYYEKLKTGKISDKNKKTATEIFSNANPLSTFERGNSVFMNMARVEMFNKYAAALYASGKNPIDHLSDFKKLASAVNTITGSGNMNQTVTMALPVLNKLMFSARYFAASWNLTPPMSLYYLAKLGNYDGMEIDKPSTWKTWKPTAAQKAFVKPMIKGFVAFYGLSLMTVAMINAAIDDDDDEMSEEEKARKRAYIEYDPRSSDFMQVISGNTRTDFFGPYRGNVVLLSKLGTGKTKNKEGEIIENGTKYGSRTDFQIGTEYLAGKANPFPGMFIRYSQGKNEKVVNPETGLEEDKRMLFDKEVGIGYQMRHNTMPIFATTVKDIVNEDPVLGAMFYTTLALFGKQTSVYKSKGAKTPEQEFLKDQEKKKSLYKLPENEKVKIRVNRKLTRVESDVKLLQNLQTAQKKGLPYFISMDAALTKEQVKDMDLSGTDESVARIKQIVSEVKAQYGIEDEE